LGSWYGGEEEYAFDGFKQNHVFFSNKKNIMKKIIIKWRVI
jgi:hypothetical protein